MEHLLFSFIPIKILLHPSIEHITNLQETYPNFRFLFPVWGVWTYSLVYIFSEMWGSVMISLLFWQFANQIVRTNEAKRYYAMFGLIANFALIVSGETIKHFSHMSDFGFVAKIHDGCSCGIRNYRDVFV